MHTILGGMIGFDLFFFLSQRIVGFVLQIHAGHRSYSGRHPIHRIPVHAGKSSLAHQSWKVSIPLMFFFFLFHRAAAGVIFSVSAERTRPEMYCAGSEERLTSMMKSRPSKHPPKKLNASSRYNESTRVFQLGHVFID